jgi:hypothetical protein
MVEYPILKRVKDQLDSLRSGFNELIPQEMIIAFDERELGFTDLWAHRRSTCMLSVLPS